MAMAPATRALIARALRQRVAAGKASVAAADEALAEREAAQAGLAAEITREGAAAGHSAEAVALATAGAAWRRRAAGRLADARAATWQAGEASTLARADLAEMLRREMGFDRLMALREAEAARQAARRDPLGQLMVLARTREVVPAEKSAP